MQWEELTAKNFPKGIEESSGVCLLPIGVLEKHGNHLPLGTDMFIGQAVCKKAAEMESAVVFPYYFLGQIAEAKHCPGCIAASHRLIMDALLEMCNEIHRNGFTKIIICSSHGGNNYFLPFFLQEMPRLKRPYNAYSYYVAQITKEQNKTICDYAKTDDLGYHAGLTETSAIMYLRPDLVDMKAQDPKESQSKERLAELREKEVFTGFNWYAEYPHHFAGDPGPSTPELGKMVFDMACENLAGVIRAVKADTESEKLIREFNLT
jgi:creatinine amidohydrolase